MKVKRWLGLYYLLSSPIPMHDKGERVFWFCWRSVVGMGNLERLTAAQMFCRTRRTSAG